MSTPTGFTQVTAQNIKDLSNNPLTGRVVFTGPVNNAGAPVAALAAGGPVLYGTSTFLVQGGKIVGTPTAPTDPTQCLVADSALSAPANIGYTVQFFDSNKGGLLVARPGYLCVQPSGPTWDLDTYVPSQQALVTVQSGPAGPSAYQEWLNEGNTGTASNFLTSLRGSQGTPGSPGPNSASTRVVYRRAFFSDLTDFQPIGMAPTLDGNGGIAFNTPQLASFDNSALVLQTNSLGSPYPSSGPYITVNDHLDLVAVFVLAAPGNGGFFVGKNAINGLGATVTWNPSIPNDLYFFPQGTGNAATPSAYQIATGTFSFATGDTVRLTYSQRGATIRAILTNLTSGVSMVGSWTSPMLPNTENTFNMPATSTVRVGTVGGAYTLVEFDVLDRQVQSPYLAVLGDSKTAGYACGSDSQRFASLLPYGQVSVYGGPGDIIDNLAQAIPDILAAKPSNILLAWGSNNVRSGASFAAPYTNAVAVLKAAGVAVAHLQPIPEIVNSSGTTGVDQSGLKAFIQSTFPNDPQIDPSVGWQARFVNTVDYVHPLRVGHAYVASRIVAANVFSGNQTFTASDPVSTVATATTSTTPTSPAAPTTSPGTLTVYPTLVSGTVTITADGYDLIFVTGANNAITLTPPTAATGTNAQRRVKLVNYGSSSQVTTLTSSSNANPLATSTTQYGPATQPYSMAALHTIELVSFSGNWNLVGIYPNE